MSKRDLKFSIKWDLNRQSSSKFEYTEDGNTLSCIRVITAKWLKSCISKPSERAHLLLIHTPVWRDPSGRPVTSLKGKICYILSDPQKPIIWTGDITGNRKSVNRSLYSISNPEISVNCKIDRWSEITDFIFAHCLNRICLRCTFIREYIVCLFVCFQTINWSCIYPCQVDWLRNGSKQFQCNTTLKT